METVWTRSAWKELQRLPKATQGTVIEAVWRYAANPFGTQPNAQPMKGEKNAVRLRVGEYRVILHRGSDRIEVRAVAHRKDVYS
jgi:mRNA-degrading endonuclease RelE of RelBE toxin-antitoxin system